MDRIEETRKAVSLAAEQRANKYNKIATLATDLQTGMEVAL
jgi:hypothetical protein